MRRIAALVLLALLILTPLPLPRVRAASMARLFDRASSEYLEVDTAAVTATPFTMSAWFNASEDNDSQLIVGLFDISASNQWFTLDTKPTRILRFQANAAASEDAETSATWTLNTWHHACAVSASSTSRSVYLDGGNKVTNTGSASPTGIDRTDIGRNGDSSPSDHFPGLIAEVAIWNVALTDEEVASLAGDENGPGLSPSLVRPDNLVFYKDLIRDINRPFIGGTLIATGTTVADHPPIIYPTQPMSGFAVAAVPPVGKRRAIIISEILKYAPAPILAGGLGLAWVINRRNKLLRGK